MKGSAKLFTGESVQPPHDEATVMKRLASTHSMLATGIAKVTTQSNPVHEEALLRTFSPRRCSMALICVETAAALMARL